MTMRIFFLVFILFLWPILFYACRDKDDCHVYVGKWTYSEISNTLIEQKSYEVYKEGDTISSDTIRFKLSFSIVRYAGLPRYISHFPTDVIACPPSIDRQDIDKVIKSLFFGLALEGDLSSFDTSLLKSLELELSYKKYRWSENQGELISDLSSWGNTSEMYASFTSPHNSKNIQVVVWAIKDNGDTLKAISPKVFCR